MPVYTFCTSFTSPLLVKVCLGKRPQDIPSFLQRRVVMHEVSQVGEVFLCFWFLYGTKLLTGGCQVWVDADESSGHGEELRGRMDGLLVGY
jgi:hypothetical protein